jgi:hypothetical protein
MGIRRSISASGLQRFVAFDRQDPDANAALPANVEWGSWLRLIERKRRMLGKVHGGPRRALPDAFYAQATFVSFRLDGLDVTEREIVASLSSSPARRELRSRRGQRVRNHAAILHSIEKSIRVNESLKPSAVVRWYTSISSGLSTSGLDDATMDRLDGVVRQINAPNTRLQSTLRDVAKLHTSLLREPLVPGFNGILCRLLLHFHLGRCALPPVLFDPKDDAARLTDETMFLARLMELIDEMYGVMIGHASSRDDA